MVELEEPKEPQVSISYTEKSIEWVINQENIGTELGKQLSQSNVIIKPSQGSNELEGELYFPSDTAELFHFLREKQSENFSVEIAVEEENYQELSLHADWIILADILVKDFIAPLLVTLLAEYIIQRVRKRIEETKVKSKITIIQEGKKQQVEIRYSGPANEYSDIMLKTISELGNIEPPKYKEKRRAKRKKHSKKEETLND